MHSMIYEGLVFPLALFGVQAEVLHGAKLPILNHAELERRVL